MPSRSGREFIETNENDISAGESIILQCVLCGIIIVFVLIISVLDFAPALQIRDGIQNALTGATTAGELIAEIQTIGEELFGFNRAYDETNDYTEQEIYIPRNYNPENVNLPPIISPEYYFPVTEIP